MYGCGEQEAGVASGSEWNLWVWLLGVVVRRYINLVRRTRPHPQKSGMGQGQRTSDLNSTYSNT